MDRLLATLLNQLLDAQPAQAVRFAGHAGKTLRLSLPMLKVELGLGADGRFVDAGPLERADCEITLTPDLLLRLPLAGGEGFAAARVTGNGVLASDLSTLLHEIDWALLLQPYVGPIVAARADQLLRGLDRWRQQARDSAAHSVAEYLVYEQQMLVEGQAVREFIAGVDELRDAASRLEARLVLLEQQRAQGKSTDTGPA